VFLALTAQDPVTNVFAEHRARASKLEPRWLAGEIWGRFDGDELRAACHVGANLVPIQAEPEDAIAFGRRVIERRNQISTIFGPEVAVRAMYDVVSVGRPEPRGLRMCQPHLELSSAPLIASDPAVRLSTKADFEVLFPACVAMYTEEVGVSPVDGIGAQQYRTRVGQLINMGWSFVRIDQGRVVFKAEVACASPYAAQIQGVYIAPDSRGQGIAAPAIAAVVRHVQAHIAPIASLYVNQWNLPARRAYARCGFQRSGTFGTVLF